MRKATLGIGVLALTGVAAALFFSLANGPAAGKDGGGAEVRASASYSKPEAADPVQLGENADLGGRRAFPDDNPWNMDITHLPVDPNSDVYINSIGADKPLHPNFGRSWHDAPWGIPYIVVPGGQLRYPVRFGWGDQADQCYYPIPENPPVEAGDRHCIIIDRDSWVLYELFDLKKQGDLWTAGAGATWDLNSNDMRPMTWTSSDAAGLAIFPGLVRYDEVMIHKEVRHAFRFTAKPTQRAFIYPARHYASKEKDAALPPMGLRVRLKADYDISTYPESCQVILRALKKYGMILADNGGAWFLIGSPHPEWPDDEMEQLKRVKGSDFEVVQIGSINKP
jgi:hypothetical protein